MTVNSAATSTEQSIYAALELSKNSWLLGSRIHAVTIRSCIRYRAVMLMG